MNAQASYRLSFPARRSAASLLVLAAIGGLVVGWWQAGAASARALDPHAHGILASADQRGEGPASLHLPDIAARGSFQPDALPPKLRPSALDGLDQWVTLLQENFDTASWPAGSGWQVWDDNEATGGEYFWDNRCAGRASTYSAWAIGGGASSSWLQCGDDYPNLVDSWMMYGPIDLTGYSDVELSFDFKLNSECVGVDCVDKSDPFYALVSTDLEDFDGHWWAGDWTDDPTADAQGWVSRGLDISSYAGEPLVWVLFSFTSDDTTSYPIGVQLDNVRLRGEQGCAKTANIVSVTTDRNCYVPGSQAGVFVEVGTSLGSQSVRVDVSLWSGDVVWSQAERTITAPGQVLVPLPIPSGLSTGLYDLVVQVFDANTPGCVQDTHEQSLRVDPVCGSVTPPGPTTPPPTTPPPTTPVPELPDIVIPNLAKNTVSTHPQNLTISGALRVQVANRGVQAVARSFRVTVFEDRNADGRLSRAIDNVLGEQDYNGGLSQGQEAWLTIPLSGNVLFRDNILFAFADSMDVVAESNENNNYNDTRILCRGDAQGRTYTIDADFDEGVLVNVNHDSPNNDQLQLDAATKPRPFIWIALSDRGTVAKIDVNSGQILAEYRSAPDGRARNPSRTTVDLNGNVWVGNRDEAAGGKGSAVKIGLEEAFQCVDRNGNGQIDTSTGLGDIRPWLNAGGADNDGGISTAQDECILNYVRVGGTNIRTVAVDRNNDVWLGGLGNQVHDLIDGSSGAIKRTIRPSCGGYGGLIDPRGVLWSAKYDGTMLRYDPASGSSTCLATGSPYGLGIDTGGRIWNSQFSTSEVVRLAFDGSVLSRYPTTGSQPKGVAVSPVDNNVWVAHSGSANVVRLSPGGAVLATIAVGNQPTGVAVDANGKVWVTNYGSDNTMRINPATNQVDLTVDLGAGAGPYNYSDMTGIVAIGSTAPQGTWTVVYDGGSPGMPWGRVSWNSAEPAGSKVGARARAADSQAALGGRAWVDVTNGLDAAIGTGRYIQVEVKLEPGQGNESPIVYDVTIETRAAAADLSASYIRIQDNAPTSVTYTARIGNGGAKRVEAGTPVAFYDGNPDLGGQLLGVTLLSRALDPGEYEDVSFTWTNPQSGRHQIYVVADRDASGRGYIEECDELNNVHWIEHVIASVCPPVRSPVPVECTRPNYLRNSQFEKIDFGQQPRSWRSVSSLGRPTVDNVGALEGSFSAHFSGPAGLPAKEWLIQYVDIPPEVDSMSFDVARYARDVFAPTAPPIGDDNHFRASIFDISMSTELVRLWEFDPLLALECEIDPPSYNLSRSQIDRLRGQTVAVVLHLGKLSAGLGADVYLDGITLNVCSALPPCRVDGNKTASPTTVRGGEQVTVQLSLTGHDGDCLPEQKSADVILAVDVSGSMNETTAGGGTPKINAAKAAALNFVDRLAPDWDQAALVSFADSARVQQVLSPWPGGLRGTIQALSANGDTNIAQALTLAQAELVSGRQRQGNLPVIVLLSDGKPTAGGDPGPAANAAKAAGTRIFTVGLGQDADATVLRALASSPSDYFHAPDGRDLDDIFQQITGLIAGVPATNITIVDRLSPYVTLVPNSFTGTPKPEVSPDNKTLTWRIPRLGMETMRWSYRVTMTDQAGTWPTNESAVASYTNSQGEPKGYIFPIPMVTVIQEQQRHPEAMCRDNTTDTGATPSNPAGEPWWDSPDIWVRHSRDGGLAHQNPESGEVNYVHVRVTNIGDAAVDNITVHVYDAPGGVGLRWPTDWTPEIGQATITRLQPGASTVVAVPWTPALEGHFCFLVRLEAPADPIVNEGWVPFDNNLCQKNVQIISGGGTGPTGQGGVGVGNRNRGHGYAGLRASSRNFPAGAKARAIFQDPGLFDRWRLAGGEVKGGTVDVPARAIDIDIKPPGPILAQTGGWQVDAVIERLPFEGEELNQIRFEVELPPGAEAPELHISQWSGDEQLGGLSIRPPRVGEGIYLPLVARGAAMSALLSSPPSEPELEIAAPPSITTERRLDRPGPMAR